MSEKQTIEKRNVEKKQPKRPKGIEVIPVESSTSSKHQRTKESLPQEPSPVDLVEAAPDQGLTKEQVEERVSAGLTNVKVDSSTKTVSEIVKSNVMTYFNLIFLVIAILLILVGSFRDLTFLPIIIANTLIGIIQEIRSKKVLDDLSILNAPKSTVVRDGEQVVISPEELVRDDIVIFTAGNQIPADAQVLDGQVSVNESLITGEADEVTKQAGDTLLSGSFIVSGTCSARLVLVGENSYISKLILQATKSKDEEQSEMIRSLNRLVKTVGFIILPIGGILFAQQYFLAGGGLRDSVTSMVAAIIGMIPEGLYLLASVAMAVSVLRLAKEKVLVHDMKCIETLARVNVLCVDKTGTITVPEMEVDDFFPIEEAGKKDTTREESHLTHKEESQREKLKLLIGDVVLCQSADNATMESLQGYFGEGTGRKAKKVISFSSATKYSGVCFENESYIIGAPEFVLRQSYSQYQEQIEAYSSKGFRVLVVARSEEELSGEKVPEQLEIVSLILMTNAIRKGARETFHYFAKCGVQIKVISGDNPKTVSEIAVKAGIENGDQYVDATTLKSEESIQKAMSKYVVFGRVTPNQKRAFVRALKEQGKTVAMTGDGVNDVLALKDADCSIAMASGSEAASQVSQLVLMDNNFSRMPSVVMEGRRVVNNIQRTASLYLVKNIFSMLLAVFSMIFMLNYPLEPSQVSLISMFTIGIPSFFLALEPNRSQIKGNFLGNVLIKAFPAGLTDFLVVSGLVVFCREFQVDAECVSTSCTILVAIVGFMILYRIAKPMTKPHIVLILFMVIGWLGCMLFISPLFAITSITKQCAMLTVVFAIITEPALRYLSMGVEYGADFTTKMGMKGKKRK